MTEPVGYCQCGCGNFTELATRSNPRWGHVIGEPMRFIRGHATTLSGDLYVVDYLTGCHVWQRARSPKGYGRMKDGGRTRSAHRVFYERKYGPVPEGLELDHTCNNPPCVNADHLEPVTHLENLRRANQRREIAA